jgi:glutaredoxin 3
MNTKFEVYSKPNCSYCDQAKSLLRSKGYDFIEWIIDVNQVKEEGKAYVSVQALKARLPSVRTVPQIFMNNEPIGGFMELQKILD